MSTELTKIITEGIEFWSPPLKKHRYRMDSVERRAFESNGTPTGTLMEYIQERERAYSGLLPENEAPAEQAIEEFSTFLEEALSEPSEDGGSENTEKPKRKFRSLKRIEKLIYDDTAVRQGELEDEAFELLNKDGFYDEVLPVDYEEDNKPASGPNVKALLLYSGALLLLVGVIIVWLKIFFL